MSPSPIPSLRAMLERSLTVADLASEPLLTVDREMSAAEAHAILLARGFDVAGVSDDSITHAVSALDLANGGSVGDHARPILATDSAEKSTPLSSLVEILGHRTHLF